MRTDIKQYYVLYVCYGDLISKGLLTISLVGVDE